MFTPIFLHKRFAEKSSLDPQIEAKLKLTNQAEQLLLLAVKTVSQAKVDLKGQTKVLPLQGIIELNSSCVHLAALKPRDESTLEIRELPEAQKIIHKRPGGYNDGEFSPRLKSYHSFFYPGPPAHQELLKRMVTAPLATTHCMDGTLHADDAIGKIGFTLSLQLDRENDKMYLTLDGKSKSINNTPKYLSKHFKRGHSLDSDECKNAVIEQEREYSSLADPTVCALLEKLFLEAMGQYLADNYHYDNNNMDCPARPAPASF